MSLEEAPKADLGKVLEQARKIIRGARQETYDSPENNYGKISRVLKELSIDLSPVQLMTVMMVTKLVRESHKHKPDNIVDLCGYADIYQYLKDREGKE